MPILGGNLPVKPPKFDGMPVYLWVSWHPVIRVIRVIQSLAVLHGLELPPGGFSLRRFVLSPCLASWTEAILRLGESWYTVVVLINADEYELVTVPFTIWLWLT
jgi:hypothetical protein